tara:strand:+ start:17352 stop:17534 length:183 start_codon:yes stop_codon:yes gene_type:complete
MPYVRFLADYDFKPKPAVTIAFQAGMTKMVTRAAAAQAMAAGKAVPADRPTTPRRAADGT